MHSDRDFGQQRVFSAFMSIDLHKYRGIDADMQRSVTSKGTNFLSCLYDSVSAS